MDQYTYYFKEKVAELRRQLHAEQARAAEIDPTGPSASKNDAINRDIATTSDTTTARAAEIDPTGSLGARNDSIAPSNTTTAIAAKIDASVTDVSPTDSMDNVEASVNILEGKNSHKLLRLLRKKVKNDI